METIQQAINRGIKIEQLPNIIHPTEVRNYAHQRMGDIWTSADYVSRTIYDDVMQELPRLKMIWGDDK